MLEFRYKSSYSKKKNRHRRFIGKLCVKITYFSRMK